MHTVIVLQKNITLIDPKRQGVRPAQSTGHPEEPFSESISVIHDRVP